MHCYLNCSINHIICCLSAQKVALNLKELVPKISFLHFHCKLQIANSNLTVNLHVYKKMYKLYIFLNDMIIQNSADEAIDLL